MPPLPSSSSSALPRPSASAVRAFDPAVVASRVARLDRIRSADRFDDTAAANRVLFCVPPSGPSAVSRLPADRPERSTYRRWEITTRLPDPNFSRDRANGAAFSAVPDRRISSCLSLLHTIPACFPRNPSSQRCNTNAAQLHVYASRDEKPRRIADGGPAHSRARNPRSLKGARTSGGHDGKKKRNSRINEIAIIDTPILALKDPLAPCTSVRDIIDPAHAIGRIPLRFN